MIGAEDGDSGLHARGQFHPATVHWRQPDGTVGWLRVEHHGADPGAGQRAPPRRRVRSPPHARSAAGPLDHQHHARSRSADEPMAPPRARPSTSTPTRSLRRSRTRSTYEPRRRAPGFDLHLDARHLSNQGASSGGRAVRFDRRWHEGDEQSIMRRGARLLWYSVTRPAAALRALHRRRRAVLGDGGGRHGGARAGDRRRADAGLRRRASSDRAVAHRRDRPRRLLGPPDGRRGAAPLLRPDGPAADAGALVPPGHRPLPRRAAALVRRAPHRRAARPRRRRLRALDDGHAAPPVLARRGAAHRASRWCCSPPSTGCSSASPSRCSRGWPCSTTPTRSASSSRPPPPRPASATCRAWPTRASRARCS